MRARRRSGLSTTPVGNWCAGVSRAALRPGARPARRRPCPSASTGTARVRRPQCSSSSRVPCDPGSSTAMSRCPRSTSTWAVSASACATPATTTTSSAAARTPRDRPSQPRQLGAQPRDAPAGRRSRASAAGRRRAPPGCSASQAARGNADRSGSPGDRSTRSDAGLRPPRRGGRHPARHGGDPGAASRPGRTAQALVDEPLVGLDDDAARHPQSGRHPARRRQPVAAWRACRRRSRRGARR